LLNGSGRRIEQKACYGHERQKRWDVVNGRA
jgi:hypothetical protein